MTVVAWLAITLIYCNISLLFLSLSCDCFSYSALLFFCSARSFFLGAQKERENQIHASLLRAPTLVHNWDELDGSKKADRGG